MTIHYCWSIKSYQLLEEVTLLRVIRTLTHYFDIVSDISSGRIYGIYLYTYTVYIYIYSDILHILSDILSGIYSDILCGIYSDGSLLGVYSDILMAFYLPHVLIFYLAVCLAFYLKYILTFSYWCLVGNGWEWGNGIIITSDYGSFPHSLLSTSKFCLAFPLACVKIQAWPTSGARVSHNKS